MTEPVETQQYPCNHGVDFTQWSCTMGSAIVSFHCPICQETIGSTHVENCPADVRIAYFQMVNHGMN